MEIKIESVGHGDSMVKDLAFGKKILDVLEQYYAMHPWFVECNDQAGTASIQLMYTGKDGKLRIWKYGYLFHLKNLDGVPDFNLKIMRAGGEILERYNMQRRQATVNDIVDFYGKEIDTAGMVQ